MTNELFTMMETGGPLMWVIFIIAFIAFTLIVWQALILFSNIRISYADYHWIQHSDNIFVADDTGNKSPIRSLLTTIQDGNLKGSDAIVASINVQLATLVPKLEGHLGTISTIGSLLPMLGLLGTVLGMINVFEVVAIHGSGKPEAMAEGIAQALLTTASGLIFAIPVIFMHHLLTRKYNELIVLVKQSAEVILQKCNVDDAKGKI